MKIYYRLEDHPINADPAVVTLGNFDGVHRGHQQLINKVIRTSKKINGESAVITFSNHPSTYFYPEKQFYYLSAPDEKIALLQKLGIDTLFVLKFDKEFAEQTAEVFLKKLTTIFPDLHLILGANAKIGRNREGDSRRVVELSKQLPFSVEFEEMLIVDNEPVTSSRIRQLIQSNLIAEAEKLLGRE